jgi:hypothetical protein
MMAILCGGICLLIAAVATLFVDYKGGEAITPRGGGH